MGGCARTLGRDHGEALVEEEAALPLDLVHQPEHHHALRAAGGDERRAIAQRGCLVRLLEPGVVRPLAIDEERGDRLLPRRLIQPRGVRAVGGGHGVVHAAHVQQVADVLHDDCKDAWDAGEAHAVRRQQLLEVDEELGGGGRLRRQQLQLLAQALHGGRRGSPDQVRTRALRTTLS